MLRHMEAHLTQSSPQNEFVIEYSPNWGVGAVRPVTLKLGTYSPLLEGYHL